METINFTDVTFSNGDHFDSIEVNLFAIEAVCEVTERAGFKKCEHSTKVMLKSGACFKIPEEYKSVIERLKAINKPQPRPREYPPRQERRYAEKR